MSTMLSTQDRPAAMTFSAPVENTASVFTGLFDLLAEISYCVSLSAQSIAFSMQMPAGEAYSQGSASRLDAWPVDLWVF